MTKGMIVVAVGALSLAGCKSKEEPAKDNVTKPPEPVPPKPPEPAKPPEPVKTQLKSGKELGDQYLACSKHIEAGEWDAFKKDCVVGELAAHVADMPQTQNGEQVIEFMKSMKTAFPDLKMQTRLVMVSDHDVFAVQQLAGTHEGALKLPNGPELPATHKKIGTVYFQRMSFSDGKVEQWTFNDPRTMMGQLGLMSKEIGPTRAPAANVKTDAPEIVVSTNDPKEQANIEAAKKVVEAINAHKPTEASASVVDDIVLADQADAADVKGKKQFEKDVGSLLKAFPDVKLEAAGYWAAGDWVVTMGTMTGTWKGQLGPLKPSGKPISNAYAEVIHVKDGKATEIMRFRNGMAIGMPTP